MLMLAHVDRLMTDSFLEECKQ